MMYQWLLAFNKPSNRLWVTPAYWALLTVIFVLSLRFGTRFFTEDIFPDISHDTLSNLLNIIASSMLAVSTFSLSIMVSAFSSAANSATPRATDLVMGDEHTRTAITSFICAFIYAIIAQTALGMGFYGQNGRFILFISTIAVLTYLIVTLIHWVYTLSQLGRLRNTLTKIEKVASDALQTYRSHPQMGATWQGNLTSRAKSLSAGVSGYLTHIDVQTLQNKAEDANCYIHINVRPGELIAPDTILCFIEGKFDEPESIRHSFVFDQQRTFAQDPNWGMIVLSEAAQKALSPGINDPGTAINVMMIMTSLLLKDTDKDKNTKNFDRISIKSIDCGEWIRDAFAPISRDGATILEVNLVMQKMLASIWRNAPEQKLSQAAFDMAEYALERAVQQIGFKPDVELLKQKHKSLFP
ncbi:DUF2254 family protein [Otariodibacter sp.]|uniref:DUF2254 domain-containing protein n=1 Tax=Otariodibacter sp. TaxID=3030919 RepID=UPI0026071397|nr:DUF2254 family protein [Otariodibacter sp.]